MKAKPDCIVCVFRQALNTARIATDNEDLQLRVLARMAAQAAHPDLDRTPAALSQPVYRTVAEVTGVRDPYLAQKQESNRVALRVLPRIARLVETAPDPLHAALLAAAAGNMIDLGIDHEYDIERDVERILGTSFALDATDRFRSELRPGRKLLYLGDNAGEIVFDTLLVRQLVASGMEVVFTVKSGPIINDALMEDAREAGMTGLVRVIETGSDDIGVDWRNVSDEFRKAFAAADVILAKGHGNFETCNERPENIYFLLKAKCAMVAAELGVKLGDIVFKGRNP